MIRAEMRSLPSGTVTFLFSDMVGSTRLLQELGAETYARALAEHRRLLREAFARHGGVEVDTQGDAFFIAFPTAPGAVAAATEAQASLARGPIQVRMGLHTGTPLLTEDGYVGVDVHRAARIAAAGHGGQALVSATTAALVDQGLRDLGEHRFKDLQAPERIYQLGADEFPPLRSLYRTNLPVPATPFLGRERELAEVTALLGREDVRLLTLTGTGGTGKTRLALQAAATAAEEFPDGITWVPLAALRDPALVLTAVAQALEAKEESARPLTETLVQRLAGTRALLVLDNVEHLLPDAAAELARLRGADGPTLLTTSRERLSLQGEHVWPVPPLDEADGVALFTARARAVEPSFAPASEVEELCARLDNLPLALELAAARTSLFSPAQLLERLEQRLDLLKGGRDVEQRHLTLRATIAWSYDLLDEHEQRLFRRLSVFAGGCTYEAAEAVCGAEPDTLQSLLDKSLVRRRDTEDGPRYWMLETLREYACELLASDGEDETILRAHAEYFAAQAERADLKGAGAEQSTLFARLDAELGNFRAAIDWSEQTGAPTTALRLAAGLYYYWYLSGQFREGQRRIATPLDGEAGDAALRALALRALAGFSWLLGDLEEAEARARAGIVAGEDAETLEPMMGCFTVLGVVEMARGRFAAARAYIERSEQIARELGLDLDVTLANTNLAQIALEAGDLEEARRRWQASLDWHRNHGEGSPFALLGLGMVALQEQRSEDAATYFEDALRMAQRTGFRHLTGQALVGLAGAAAARQDYAQAAQLLGRASAILDEVAAVPSATEAAVLERTAAAARAALGDEVYGSEFDAARVRESAELIRPQAHERAR